jgi:hypothetical protein
VYSRELDGEILTIAASGWTYDNLFVLQDYATHSLWYHLPGTTGLTCIAGEREGATLPAIDTYYGPWSGWIADHPGTLLLMPEDIIQP